MSQPDRKSNLASLVFALFLVVVFSLGTMKPALRAPASLTPTDLIFLFAFIAWLSALAVGICRFRWHRVYWAFGVYLLALAISTAFSTNVPLSLRKLPGEVYLITLAVIASNLVTTVERFRLAVFAWLAGAVIPVSVALAGIVLFYAMPESPLLDYVTYHYGAVPVGNFPRINSTFVSPSMLCNYLTVTAIILIIAKQNGWIRRSVAWISISTVLVVSAFTASIALGGLGLAGALFAHAVGAGKGSRLILLAAGGFAAMAFIVVAPFALQFPVSTPYTFELPLFGTVAPSSRLLVWADALQTFIDHPLTGKGLDTPSAGVLYQNYDGTTSFLTDAHNMFLNVAAQAGLAGLVGLIALIFAMTKTSLANLYGEFASVRTGLAIAFVCAFIYDGLTGSFENARHLWVLFGLILAVESGLDTNEPQ